MVRRRDVNAAGSGFCWPGRASGKRPATWCTLPATLGAIRRAQVINWAFDKAWCDEYAPWSRHNAQEGYDMLWSCLREADAPLGVISGG
ncbi:hypothetical protein [Streptomyces peucetius]|uniref:Resolvase/invertase-type recombinase catalytic domain-containing protein n=1 Tax=Streptomyces peucetius TaxID=1950 RepID=A0ABY6I709_STRPE|nr:hypothetical protein [Streptomyces peucetius]UYQ62708.1 hypothetical protein OGH68_15295 [Streptomyces peucetius]